MYQVAVTTNNNVSQKFDGCHTSAHRHARGGARLGKSPLLTHSTPRRRPDTNQHADAHDINWHGPRHIGDRIKRVMAEIERMPQDRRAALVHLEPFGHLTACIDSAADLCKQFGSKSAIKRLISHKGDEARFAELRQQLNEAEGGLKLSLAIDQAGWREAQEHDQRDAMRAIEELVRAQGETQGTLEEMKAQMGFLTMLVQGDHAKADHVDKGGGRDELQVKGTYVNCDLSFHQKMFCVYNWLCLSLVQAVPSPPLPQCLYLPRSHVDPHGSIPDTHNYTDRVQPRIEASLPSLTHLPRRDFLVRNCRRHEAFKTQSAEVTWL